MASIQNVRSIEQKKSLYQPKSRHGSPHPLLVLLVEVVPTVALALSSSMLRCSSKRCFTHPLLLLDSFGTSTAGACSAAVQLCLPNILMAQTSLLPYRTVRKFHIVRYCCQSARIPCNHLYSLRAVTLCFVMTPRNQCESRL